MIVEQKDPNPPAQAPSVADERLRKFATDKQWESYTAWILHQSYSKAARELDVNHKTLKKAIKSIYKKAAQQGYAPHLGYTHEIPEGLASRGNSIRYDGDGVVTQEWVKSKVAGVDPEDESVHKIPNGLVTKVSTLYNERGEVAQQWVQVKPEDVEKLNAWREIAKDITKDIEPLKKFPVPPKGPEDLLVCYPVGDLHLGMLAWDKETSADWDLKIGERVFEKASEYLVNYVPYSDTALVAFLGDFMHYDSFDTVTPTSGNLLDADSRYPKMVRVAIRCARSLIEKAAAKHRNVHVIVEIGNHDLSSSVFLTEALHAIYENNPRIHVDSNPSQFHYFEFGNVLIGTHHGHNVKPDRLPGIMAADRSKAWGRTQFRYWLTGHVHNQRHFDFPGVSVESFRVLAPKDAWTSNMGHRAPRDTKAIVYHKEYGEVSRLTVNPSMFGEAQDTWNS